MACDIWVTRNLRAHILAGVVLTIRGTQRQGGDPLFVAGILAMAEHNALALGINWSSILDDARAALGVDVSRLIDQALTLDAGARIAPGA